SGSNGNLVLALGVDHDEAHHGGGDGPSHVVIADAFAIPQEFGHTGAVIVDERGQDRNHGSKARCAYGLVGALAAVTFHEVGAGGSLAGRRKIRNPHGEAYTEQVHDCDVHGIVPVSGHL